MSQSKRHTLEQEIAYLRTEYRRAKRGARWLGESRDYWRGRARVAEIAAGIRTPRSPAGGNFYPHAANGRFSSSTASSPPVEKP